MTNSLTKGLVAGVAVTVDPAIEGVKVESDFNGKYSANLPTGTYTLTFKKDNFTPGTQKVTVIAGQTVAQDVALKPVKPVVVDAGANQAASPGGAVTLSAFVDVLDSSTVNKYQWTQTAGAATKIEDADRGTAKVTLASTAAYKEELIKHLNTLDRFTVQAINPHSLEEAEATTFKVTVTTSSGSYSDTVNVTANLPLAVNTGIQNVPKGVPVLLHGKTQDSYSWTLTSPSGSKAALDDASSQNPSFTPDLVGKYALTETTSGATIDVYAGTWAGVITGQDANGRPVAANCTACHNGTFAPDMFTPWKESGHAEIFTQNINNPAGHWGEGCASCHTVGYNPAVANNGFDEAMAAEGWKVPPHGEVGYWTMMLSKFPKTAQLANIQCESCHGPNDGGGAHTLGGAARISISSDVCGACHGEPLRHARFQQWEESKHGDFTLAIERGTSSSCARCHAGQGFLAWLPQLQAGDSGNLKAQITWTADTVQPQTCVVCHDPHAQGTTSGEPNTATVRIEGDTPMLPAGFKAVGMGRGAICITCHNSRNGAHNDAVAGLIDDRAPHTAAQGDVFMGQNAYFVTVGDRSPHSFITDTCAKCHMELTPPPAEWSYNLAGTNHSFEASMAICTNCHGIFDGGTLHDAVEALLEELETAIAQAIKAELASHTGMGHVVVLKGFGAGGADVNITDAAAISTIHLEESHGRIAMDITVGGTEYTHIRVISDTTVKDSAGTEVSNLFQSASGQTVLKAAWNYFLIEGDGTHGVHNPSFTVDVLNASIDALK